MRLLIIRHGDPDYAHDTLTEKGHREAALLAEKMKNERIDFLYSSPLGRAKDTGIYVAKALNREKDVKIEPLFREFNIDKAVVLPDGTERHLLWDLLPTYWTNEKEFYDKQIKSTKNLTKSLNKLYDGDDEEIKNSIKFYHKKEIFTNN